LLRLAARIANHARAAADDRDRRMAEALHPREAHHRQQTADVKARRRRIESDVPGYALLRERIGETFGRLRHQPAPLQLVEEIRHESNGLLYQSVGVTRRALLKTFVAGGVGAFAILGNHDDDHDMPVALARKGVQMLKDARTRLHVRNEPIDLVGIRFWTKRQSDIAALVRDRSPATILLAHDPRRLVEAAALNIPLVLSGHTHGGQVVLPAVGPV